MLEALRSFVGGWVAKILLVLLVASFAVWGVSGTILTAGSSTAVATVGETNVSVVDYISSYNRSLNSMSRQIGTRLTQKQARAFGVEQRALTDVVTSATLDEFTREMNMSLSEETLARMIGENPAFHSSAGKFSRQRFQTAVRQAGMREADFIKAQNANAVRSQVMEGIANGDLLPKVFSKALATFANEERQFEYITVTSELAGNPTPATAADLKTYFEANTKKYAAPEYRKLSILALEPKNLADETLISDEAVRKDYDTRADAFRTPEKRRVQQIVLSKEKAEKAINDMKSGATFETVLAENNVKLTDADLGLVEKGAIPAALRDIAFKLDLNNTSDILDGPFGATILRVSEIAAESVTPFEQVSAEIRKDLALREAADRVLNFQTEVEDIRAGGANLVETADRLGLKIRTVDAVDRQGRDDKGNVISDLPNSRDLLKSAYESQPGDQPSPQDLNTIGSLWFEVLEIIPARDRKQDEVTDRLAADWLADANGKLVSKKAEELLTLAKSGTSFADIATQLTTQSKQTALLKRGGSEEAFPATATRTGFGGNAETIAIADDKTAGTKILLRVAQAKAGSSEVSDALKREIEQANSGAANDVLQQFIVKLQSKYSVTYNRELMQQALARNY